MAAKDDTSVRSIEDLTAQYGKLNERKIQADTQLKTATEQLKSLQKEAVDNFGTSDIEELQTKLAAMEAENEERRSEYQTLLEGIAADLAKVENENSSDDAMEETDDD